jgi:hypothetical protein
MRRSFFFTFPKTAGTTLNRIIEWQYNPFSIFTIDPHRIRATPERKTFSEQRRRQFRVVRGHMFYGIHEFLPQGATDITMLRDPVARLLSAYSFILRRPLNPMHRKLKRRRVGPLVDRCFLNAPTARACGIGARCLPRSLSRRCKPKLRRCLLQVSPAAPAQELFDVFYRRLCPGTRNDFEIPILCGAILFWAIALTPRVALFFLLPVCFKKGRPRIWLLPSEFEQLMLPALIHTRPPLSGLVSTPWRPGPDRHRRGVPRPGLAMRARPRISRQ